MRKYGENLLFFCWVNNISLTLSENKKLCVLCWRSGGVVSFLLSVSARICLCRFNSISFSYAEFTFFSHHSCHLFCYILSSVPHLRHRCCLRSAWANFVVNKRRAERHQREINWNLLNGVTGDIKVKLSERREKVQWKFFFVASSQVDWALFFPVSRRKTLSSSRKTSKNRHHGSFTAYRSMRRKKGAEHEIQEVWPFLKCFLKGAENRKVRKKKKRGRKEEWDGKFAPSLKEKFCLLFFSSRLFPPTFSMKKRPSPSLERLVYVTHSSSIKTPKRKNFRSLICVERKCEGVFLLNFPHNLRLLFLLTRFFHILNSFQLSPNISRTFSALRLIPPHNRLSLCTLKSLFHASLFLTFHPFNHRSTQENKNGSLNSRGRMKNANNI